MDRGARWATAHGVAESDMTEWLTLSLFFFFSSKSTITISFLFPFHLESCFYETYVIVPVRTPTSFRCSSAQAGLSPPLLNQSVFLQRQGARVSQEDAGILRAAFFMEQIKDKHKSFWDFDLNLNPFIFLK